MASAHGEGERVLASPLAKKLAQDKGINISEVNGSGENGRIVRRDVETFQPKPAAPVAQPAQAPANKPAPAAAPAFNSGPVAPGVESFDEVPVSQMRKTIARRLSESLFTAPHFYLTMEIDMSKAVEARKSINDYAQSKISFNDLVLKASAAALRPAP